MPSNADALIQFDLSSPRFTEGNATAPPWMEQNLANLQTKIEAIIAAMTPEMDTRVIALLTEYADISTSPMSIQKSQNDEGTIINHPRQVEMIRQKVGDTIGFAVPQGGFTVSYRRAYANAGSKSRY
ncbi:MAG: hypothetical protein V3T31_08025 [candidate division Zixibacteria bacterium]